MAGTASEIGRIYLLAYNSLSFLLWGYIGLEIILHTFEHGYRLKYFFFYEMGFVIGMAVLAGLLEVGHCYFRMHSLSVHL